MSLVERDWELEQLDAAFAEAAAGSGRVVVVGGVLTGGKTELMRQFGRRICSSEAELIRASGSCTESKLPLGLARQLFAVGVVDRSAYGELERLLDPALITRARFDGALTSSILHGLSAILLEKAARAPLVLIVDDVQSLDEFSKEWLIYLIRRATSAKLLVLLGWSQGARSIPPTLREFYTEIWPQEYCRRLQLTTLSRDGVRAVLAERVGDPAADRLIDSCYGASGGNPLLVKALLEDYQTAALGARDIEDTKDIETVIGGDAYVRSVLIILHRAESQILDVATALAVFGDAVQPALLGAVHGIPTDQVIAAVDVLTRAGLLRDGRFCHPAARSAVLDAMPADERAEVHVRAARLLHGAGADAIVVAGHLLASGQLATVRAVPYLLKAADQALAQGRLPEAVDFLRSAYQACDDDEQRLVILARLARTEWRINSRSMLRYLPELSDAVVSGRLCGRDSLPVIMFMLLYGRFAEAASALARVTEESDGADAETVGGLALIQKWLPVGFPGERSWVDAQRWANGAATVGSAHQMAEVLRDAFVKRSNDNDIALAHQLLRQQGLAEYTLLPLIGALLVLVHAEQFDEADGFCARLLRSARTAGENTWYTMFSAVAANIALHRGFLAKAEDQARVALNEMPVEDWGVAAGLPLSTIVLAQTLLGKHAQAASYVAQQVPDSMFDSVFCLSYLVARGRYHLAADLPQAAIDDFQACGDLITRWGFDLTCALPWRAEIANAYLQMGKDANAKPYIQEQLRCLGSGRTRSHARALRLLAATRQMNDRPTLLREAAEMLRRSGDQFELANTLSELHRVYRVLGQTRQARSMARKANEAARVCQFVGDVTGSVPQAREPEPGEIDLGDPLGAGGVLTEAERRVAVHAVQGHTNREIADKLYVTISTVEQHLTHIYRKLGVTGRSDLLARLDPELINADLDFPVPD
jgi:DNA-binding CsgD family transcriptional regulator